MIFGSSGMAIYVILNLVLIKIYENYLYTTLGKVLAAKTKDIIQVEIMDEGFHSDIESSIPDYDKVRGEVNAVRFISTFSKILKQFPKKRPKREPKKLKVIVSKSGSFRNIPTTSSIMSSDHVTFKFSQQTHVNPFSRKISNRNLDSNEANEDGQNQGNDESKDYPRTDEKHLNQSVRNEDVVEFNSSRRIDHDKDPSFLSDDDIGAIIRKGLRHDSLDDGYIENMKRNANSKKGSCFVFRGYSLYIFVDTF